MTVMDDILSSSFDEYDGLPITAKITLATRLLNSMGTDLGAMRSRIFHDGSSGISLPTLRQDYRPPFDPATGALPLRPTPGPRRD